MTSWMLYNRSTRSKRPHRSRLNEDNCVEFNLSKDVKQNLTEALRNICRQHGVDGVKKLAYLNAIVKLVSENDVSEYGCSTDELLCCLRVGLVHEATQVRAATLRAIRYLLKTEQDVVTINKLLIPYFISRSMDVNIRNEIERIQALRIVRRILFLAPKYFTSVLARSLVSITNGGIEEKDQAFRVFLAVLSELGVLNPHLLINCGGVSVLCRVVTTGQTPGITEAVVGVLLRLLSHPEMRSSVSLLCLAAPYCELESAGVDRSKEDWDQRFAASKYALLSVLRSFPGILHFCHPNENSGLKAITNILYVEQLEVRGAVLELFYELLGLPLPTWTDEPDVALAAVDPRRFRESWKLSDGFVAAEGKTILPPVTSHCPNITEVHSALLVYILIESGLHRALAETIVTSDTFICVRAAVLLGALLHMAHSLLPPEICDLTPPLPTLLEHASVGRRQALAAVAILSRMHSLMRRRLLPISLFMDRLLQAGTWLKPSYARGPRNRHSSLRHWLKRQSPLTQLIKDSQVLNSKDALAWNWSAVRTTLRARNDVFRLMQDSDHRLFIKKLIRYFKPSTNQYSRVELSTIISREATLAGCDLINFCMDLEETECKRFLDELLSDIAEQIVSIRTAKSAHDCLFSPKHVTSTCCQKYFLFVGQLSHSPRGACLLKGFQMLEKLQDLVVNTKHDCYVKLIVSCLDYSKEGDNRKVLKNILQDSALEMTRLYTTQFLRILLRTKLHDTHHWVVGLLLDKLNDNARSVALAALEALHEACEDPKYLEIVLEITDQKLLHNWDQWLANLGDLGHLLKIRLYSNPSAFASLPSPAEELEKWIRPGGFAERYAGLVESEIHDSLTRRQRGENGCYMRRTSGSPIVQKDVFVPPHLIGQLVQHEMGLQLLSKRNVLQRFARIVHRFWNECGNTASQMKDPCSSREENKCEEKKNEVENSRLETILDSEGIEKSEYCTPLEPHVEIRRKLSQDDSRRTTPERSWIGEFDPYEDNLFSIEGRILKVKSALWALGHAGTSPLGVEQLIRLNILELITCIAETCPYYSVRAIAIYALSLVSTSRVGADALTVYGWSSLRYKRGDHWPVVQPGPTCSEPNSQSSPSPVSMQRHHRSLSDGKPEHAREPELVTKRQRNRSESAVTDVEVRRCMLTERAETPSPHSSVLRLSQQDAEGYAKLRSLQRHRIPSFSHSSLEMHSLDGRLSLQSLSEIETSRSWLGDSVMAATPPPSLGLLSPPPHTPQPLQTLEPSDVSQPSTSFQNVEELETPDNNMEENPRYLGICLPKRLSMIFPDSTPTDVLLEKVRKSRSKYESRRNQNLNTSESLTNYDDGKSAVQSIHAENLQNQIEIHSDPITTIPTIILEERSKASGDQITVNRSSVNESDSEAAVGTSTSNRLLIPENLKSKNRKTSLTKQSASDVDEESSSEYEATSDHSRLCLICYRDKSASKDSVDTDLECRRPFDKVRREILRHAQRLANPVFYKHSRQTLLTLRQQNPDIFQDVCIYSEVAARLANNTYRIQARRFLQELFFDSSFDALFDEPSVILKLTAYKPDNEAQVSNVPTVVEQHNEPVVVSSLPELLETSEAKVNGRVALTTDKIHVDQSAVVGEEKISIVTSSPIKAIVTENLCTFNVEETCKSSVPIMEDRRSDEKIIAEILKPEERMRVPKNSEKILKATGINTAVSLD